MNTEIILHFCNFILYLGVHDVIMIQVLSVTLTSQADNPLPHVVLNKDLYRKAVSTGLTSQPGSEMEDRQYQLDITGLCYVRTWISRISPEDQC